MFPSKKKKKQKQNDVHIGKFEEIICRWNNYFIYTNNYLFYGNYLLL